MKYKKHNFKIGLQCFINGKPYIITSFTKNKETLEPQNLHFKSITMSEITDIEITFNVLFPIPLHLQK